MTLPRTALRRTASYVIVLALAAACRRDDATARMAVGDSARPDSITAAKSELLDEVMASTQFVTEINAELAKVRDIPVATLAGSARGNESEVERAKAERRATIERVRMLVARLDSAQQHLEATRTRAQSLAKHDARLAKQVAEYERTVTGLKETAERQRAELETVISQQTAQIALLNAKLDTLGQDNSRLTTERAALVDTVGQLTTEKNTVYYVVGTKEELVKKGILTEEGHKRFLVFGGRRAEPARNLDSTVFLRLDRLRDRDIPLPAGEYTIVSRHNPALATSDSTAAKEGKLSGKLHIEQPEKFWAPSKYLIVVKS